LALIIFVVSEKKAFEHFPCGSGHLGFPMGIKKQKLGKGHSNDHSITVWVQSVH
jgi:hypothetical protein